MSWRKGEAKSSKRSIFRRRGLSQWCANSCERIICDGKRIVLASSAKEDALVSYKRIAGIEDLVREETAAGDAERSKPHPDIFEAALRRLGCVAPHEAIVVGDTPYDAEAANEVGLRTIGLLSGGWSAEELHAAGCIATYCTAADLLARYDEPPLVEL